jgi:hypothetical protein
MRGAPVRRATYAAIVLIVLLFPPPLRGEHGPPADRWTFAIRPYLWAPSPNGKLKYDIPPGSGGGPEVDLTSYILENLQAVLMVSGEARKGDWAMIADFVYLDVESQNSEVTSVDFNPGGGRVTVPAGVNLGTTTSLRGWEWELAGSRTVARRSTSSIDLLAGVRYLDIKASTNWLLAADVNGPGPGLSFARSGGISERVMLWDGIVGVRGQVGIGRSRWSVPYYLDVGAGSSDVTLQAIAGIQYAAGWANLQVIYRYLFYDMSGDRLLQNLSFSGPAIGANFRF